MLAHQSVAERRAAKATPQQPMAASSHAMGNWSLMTAVLRADGHDAFDPNAGPRFRSTTAMRRGCPTRSAGTRDGGSLGRHRGGLCLERRLEYLDILDPDRPRPLERQAELHQVGRLALLQEERHLVLGPVGRPPDFLHQPL